MREAALAGGELDRIVPEHDDGPRHLADLVAAFNAANVDVHVVCGEPPMQAARPSSGAESQRLT
jgi:hypothetical protein